MYFEKTGSDIKGLTIMPEVSRVCTWTMQAKVYCHKEM